MSVPSSSLSLPTGFRFVPTDEEIVSLYLWNKIHKNDSYAFIPNIDVYSQEPWMLPLGNSPCFQENEWYCFVSRVNSSGKKGNGKRPKRTVDGDISGGCWKATEGDKGIMSKNGQMVGLKKNLTFFTYKKVNAGGKREKTKSDWIMTEYSLPSDSFQESVLCKIRHKNSAKNSTPQIMQEQTDFEIPMPEAPNLPTADGPIRVPSSSDPEGSLAESANRTEDDWFNELIQLLG